MTVDAVMPLRDVKNHLSEVVGLVEREHQRVTITRNGRPSAVVLSADDLASLEETLEVLSQPALMQRVREGAADLEAGNVETMSKAGLQAGLQG